MTDLVNDECVVCWPLCNEVLARDEVHCKTQTIRS